ncbi:LPXTG cell wall anchor domain-containing protein [Macrococcus capreoli]|uniref:LPXTG cell wall anchor domain-containing protein n=1 Tax=Macrococcus capreoli TaxID=2982690 RepID=UPI0021D59782|nr:LPXTG cell wall anchor domain-containing protein [Macrococcus sp. TMW 2.2395]MCU7557851.1 LPXTG cell wall anchor domain-containing protein [Macrococcus sp. TMW 2.2395]
MKKFILSLVILISLSLPTHADAHTNPTVLYFHDTQHEPIQHFPFKVEINEEMHNFNALDDGYKVLEDDVESIEVAGIMFKIHPGELNEIEVFHPDVALRKDTLRKDAVVTSTEMPSTETPDTTNRHTITVFPVDRSFSKLEDGTIVYLKLNDKVITQQEVADGAVTFPQIKADQHYTVSFDKTSSDNDLAISANEEKYFIYERQTRPVKRMQTMHVPSRSSYMNASLRKAPEDIPPLIARRQTYKEERKTDRENDKRDTQSSDTSSKNNKQTNTSTAKKQSERKTRATEQEKNQEAIRNRNVKPQLPVNNRHVNPLQQSSNRTDNITVRDNTMSPNVSPAYRLSKDITDARQSNTPATQENTTANTNSSNATYRDTNNTHPQTSTSTDTKQDDDAIDLPATGEAMSILLPLAALMTVAAGLALLYFTRKEKQ